MCHCLVFLGTRGKWFHMNKRPIRRIKIPLGAGSEGLSVSLNIELPRVTSIGLVQVGPKWKVQTPHSHGEYEVHFVRRGQGEIIHLGKPFPLKAGDIYLFKPGESHGCGSTKPIDPLQIFYLQFKVPKELESVFVSSTKPQPLFLDHLVKKEVQIALSNLADEFLSLKDSGLNKNEMASKPSLHAFILHALGSLLVPQITAKANNGTSREKELSESILRILETSTKTLPTLSQLAKQMNVTSSYLGESLRNSTGQTYPNIIANIRMEQAKKLLTDTSMPLREIAKRVGLSSPRALTRIFQRITGKTPKAFRVK